MKANVSETGINEPNVFNTIPNFHVTVNSVCDFMHDVSEGVARLYDMAVIINCLINHKYFSLEDLNQRMLLFEYGMTKYKNTPPPISQNHLKNNCIIMSASEMCFVRYFGLIVGNLVPLETEIWKLYIHLRKMMYYRTSTININLRKMIDIYCASSPTRMCTLTISFNFRT